MVEKDAKLDTSNELKDAKSQHQGEEIALGQRADVAANFLAGVDQSIKDEPISSEETRHLLRKIDWILMPLLSFSVILAAVDKVIISNAGIYGMRQDTNFKNNEYSWIRSIFYSGFLVAEWPGNVLIQKLPIRILYAVTVFGWAVMTFLTGATQNFGGLAAVRFIMGIFESIVFPVCTLVTAMWWMVSEQPIRVAIWFNNLSSIISGLLSYGIGHSHSAIAPWHLLFIVLGVITTLWSVAVYVFMPSSPVEAWWLNDREKYICLERVRKSNTGIEDKSVKWYQVKECLLDPKAWLISIAACALNIPNGTLVTFSSIIVNGLGFTPLEITLLGVPTGVVATIWSIAFNVAASRLPGYRCILIFTAILFPMVSAICLWRLPQDNRVTLLGPYYAFYSYWAPYTMATSLPMANTSGHTKKVTFTAMFFLGYCAGNILGPQVFRDNDAPTYHKGYIGLLASLIVAAVCVALYGLLCKLDNMRRDKLQQGVQLQLTEEEKWREAFSDQTDKEKLNFRYSY
ncbi:allantoate permease [Aspergillus crustosus]